MIRHRPEGRGHAYLIEPDQRVPMRPLEGVPFELRATTERGVEAVQLELDVDGALQVIDAQPRGDAVPDVDAVWGVAAPRVDEGHLSDAVARLGEQPGRVSWTAEAPGVALRYRFSAEGRSTHWFAVAPTAWNAEGGTLSLQGEPADRLVAGSVEWLTDGRLSYRLRFALRLEQGERVVGFGERFDALDQRGRRVDTAVFDQYKGQGARSYLPMPFGIVVGGDFGFHIDTGRRCWFDVGASDPDLLQIEVDLEPGELDPVIGLRLFEGDPSAVLRAFAEVPATAPPDWVYELWMSGNEWNSQARVLAEVERSEREGIDTGVIVIEAWSDEETFVAFNDAEYEPHPDGSPHSLADFTFPENGRWPDPKGMVDDLHARGIKVLLWQIPLVESDNGAGGFDRRTMLERDYCVRLRDGRPYRNRGWWFPGALMPDFTNPKATDWWLAKRRYLVDEVGIDGFKTDGGEHAWGPTSSTPTAPTVARRTTAIPCSTGRRTTGCSRHLQPRRLHRLRRRSVPLGRRRGLHLGGISRLDHRRPLRRCVRRLLLGLGPRRLLRRGADSGALSAQCGCGGPVADHAVPLGVQPPSSAVPRSHAVERCGADRERRRDRYLPPVHGAAYALDPVPRSRRTPCSNRTAAADASTVLRRVRGRTRLGVPLPVPARRRPARRSCL